MLISLTLIIESFRGYHSRNTGYIENENPNTHIQDSFLVAYEPTNSEQNAPFQNGRTENCLFEALHRIRYTSSQNTTHLQSLKETNIRKKAIFEESYKDIRIEVGWSSIPKRSPHLRGWGLFFGASQCPPLDLYRITDRKPKI
ncbi:MAG: hypothetical protein RLN81_12645 [Balneolaceae bacterium]